MLRGFCPTDARLAPKGKTAALALLQKANEIVMQIVFIALQ